MYRVIIGCTSNNTLKLFVNWNLVFNCISVSNIIIYLTGKKVNVNHYHQEKNAYTVSLETKRMINVNKQIPVWLLLLQQAVNQVCGFGV